MYMCMCTHRHIHISLGTILAFTSHILSSSSITPGILQLLILLFPAVGTITSIPTAIGWSLSTTMITDYWPLLPICLDLEGPQNLRPPFFHKCLWNLPSGLGRLWSMNCVDVPVHQSSQPFWLCRLVGARGDGSVWVACWTLVSFPIYLQVWFFSPEPLVF